MVCTNDPEREGTGQAQVAFHSLFFEGQDQADDPGLIQVYFNLGSTLLLAEHSNG